MRVEKELSLAMMAIIALVFTLTVKSLRAIQSCVGATGNEVQTTGWIVAVLGLIGIAFSLFVWFRLLKRIVLPLREILDVLDAQQHGEQHRRVHLKQAPPDLEALAIRLNEALDRLKR